MKWGGLENTSTVESVGSRQAPGLMSVGDHAISGAVEFGPGMTSGLDGISMNREGVGSSETDR